MADSNSVPNMLTVASYASDLPTCLGVRVRHVPYMGDAALADAVETVERHGKIVTSSGRFCEMGGYIQHGNTSTLEHCVAVAVMGVMLARRFGLSHDDGRLVHAALLHDYYLYDWHDGDSHGRGHAFTHPMRAARNASRDYPWLTDCELSAIRTHMFPLTPVPPTSRIGWIVTVADKVIAMAETIDRDSVRTFKRDIRHILDATLVWSRT